MPRIFSTIPSSAGFAFTIFQTPFGTSPTATSANDALTFTGSSQVIITGDASTKTINIGITNLPASGITTGSIGTTFPLYNSGSILGLTYGTVNSNNYLGMNLGGSAPRWLSFLSGVTTGLLTGISGAVFDASIDIKNILAPAAPGASYLRLSSQTQGGVDTLSYTDSQGVQVVMSQDVDTVMFNNSGTTYLLGTPIRFNGSVVTIDSVITPCFNTALGSSGTQLAEYVLATTVGASATGRAMRFGIIRNIDTYSASLGVGTVLYLSGLTAGAWTNVAPTEPNFVQQLGKVYRFASLGVVGVDVQTLNASVDQTTGNIGVLGYLDIKNIATPSPPGISFVRIFSRTGFGIDSLTYVDSGGIEIGIGQDVDQIVFNSTGTTFLSGTPIRFGGGLFSTVPPIPSFVPAIASGISTIADWILIQACGPSLAARAMRFGQAQNIDTSSYAVNQVIYLSAGTTGALTTTPPTAPNFSQRLGKVAKSSTLGNLFIQVQDIDGNESGSNVQFFSVGNGISGPVGLQFRGVTLGSVWYNPVKAQTLTIPGFTSGSFVMDGSTNTFIGRNEFLGSSYFTLRDPTNTNAKALFDLTNIGSGSTFYYAFPNTGGTFCLTGASQTIWNKEILPRGVSTANGATLLGNWNTGDFFEITATGTTMTFPNPAGTGANGAMMMYKVMWGTTNGQYAYGANFRGSSTFILQSTACGISAMDVFIWLNDTKINKVQLSYFNQGA